MQAARGASLIPSDPTSSPSGPSGRQGARKGALVVFAAIAAAGYLTDLVTKVLAVQHLTGRDPVPVVGDLLTLYLARNPGAAFSTGTSYTVVLTFVAMAAAIGVLSKSEKALERRAPTSTSTMASTSAKENGST